jgi:hypothetical protein
MPNPTITPSDHAFAWAEASLTSLHRPKVPGVAVAEAGLAVGGICMPGVKASWTRDAKERQAPHISNRANSRGISAVEYQAAAIERARSLLGSCDLRSRISHDGLKRLFREGRRTTHFEAPTAPESWDADRAICEAAMFEGYSADPAVVRPRPTYGYFYDRVEPPGEDVRPEVSAMLSNYGNVVLVLDEAARATATLTFGDSMVLTSIGTVPRVAPTDALDPDYSCNDYEQADLLDLTEARDFRDGSHRWQYVEAQLHLDVTPDSIREIVFLIGVGPDVELARMIDDHEIPWRLG